MLTRPTDQEYDAEMYDDNDGEDDDEHPIESHEVPGPLSSSEFAMNQRGQAGNTPMTSGQRSQQLPALASAEGGTGSQSTSGNNKEPNGSAGENMLQQYYSTGSWTVDLFSDPYMMGPLQFPNPFTSFPTSSMR